LRLDGRDMPTVTLTIATVGKVEAESSQNPLTRQPVFASMDVVLDRLSL
jgi:hypothetical protein